MRAFEVTNKMRSLSWCLAALLASDVSVAVACSWSRPPNEVETRRQVQQAIRDSDVIVEAVVEETNVEGDGIALLRTVRLWKGPREASFRVLVATSCSGGFGTEDRGKLVRVALWFGSATQLYAMPIIRQPRLYQRLLDRELRRMTPYTP